MRRPGKRTVLVSVLALTILVALVGGAPTGAGAQSSISVIEGTVTSSATGQRLPGIRVLLNDVANGTWHDKASTDVMGSYRFEDVPAGEYRLWFYDHGGTYLAEWHLDATDAASATRITVDGTYHRVDATLAPTVPAATGIIEGKVTAAPTGNQIPGIRVLLNDVANGTWHDKASTDHQGQFRFEDVPAGEYRLWFYDHGGTWVDEWHLDAPDAASATRITVDGTYHRIDATLAPTDPSPTAVLEGTVTSTATGGAIGGIRVLLNDVANGTWHAKVSTDVQGRYQIDGIPGGEYRIWFYDHGGTYLDEWHLDAPDAASATRITMTGVATTVDAALTPAVPPEATLTDREESPVVLTGADLPDLLGHAPGDLVAMAWLGDAWAHIPVQVDERHVADLKQLRDGTGSIGVTTLAYSDPSSNAGPDPTATFDADDELVLMADLLGPRAPASTVDPGGVQAGTRVDVQVTDPLTPGAAEYASLFVRSAVGPGGGPPLDPAAARDLVSYTFAPSGGGAELSTVSTASYSTRFTARWTRDLLSVRAPNGLPSGDLLDRAKVLFAPGTCSRSEDTFSAGDGGFATNVDGPIRAIRSYLGANSGTYTQREHVFYRRHEVTTTFLRVHEIPAIMDFWDHTATASGMTYANDLLPSGVVVDGSPDVVPNGTLSWERLEGGFTTGGLVHVHDLQTDVTGLTVGSWYADDTTPETTQCTGDAVEYGAAGSFIQSTIPNTDPTQSPSYDLTATRTSVYGDDVATAANVVGTVDQVRQPLVGSAAP